MQGALEHRGPDSRGEHIEPHVALAHTRLSIIDLGGGKQPLYGASGKHCLIANGEIYNFIELRADDERNDYPFTSGSDCETILSSYHRYGDSCMERLRGMFAFALWDADRYRLLLARDRMGEKPLYYHFDGKTLVFASELRALLASGLVPRILDPNAIARYFRYQYIPEPQTPFLGIHKLPAACALTFDVRESKLDIRQYWRPWTTPPLEAEASRTIRSALEDAVRTSLVADVPIGLSLSGGIDCSVLATLMQRFGNKSVHAFSVGYPSAGAADERSQAKALAGHLGMVFHDVEIDDATAIRRFPEMVAKRDEPIADIAGLSYMAIMERAQLAGVPVIMQGHGIDELCWGYPWVKEAAHTNRNLAAGDSRFQMFELQPYAAWIISHATDLFTDSFRSTSGWAEMTPMQEYGRSGLRADLEVTRLITEYYLRSNGIAQGDRLAMAYSIELRLPFVDHRFVETIIGLRKHARDDHLPPKHLFKESVRDLVSSDVLDRPKKGFSPPTHRWQEGLRRRYGHLLRDGMLVHEGILTAGSANDLSAAEEDNQAQAIVGRMALTLEIWLQTMIGNQAPDVIVESAYSH